MRLLIYNSKKITMLFVVFFSPFVSSYKLFASENDYNLYYDLIVGNKKDSHSKIVHENEIPHQINTNDANRFNYDDDDNNNNSPLDSYIHSNKILSHVYSSEHNEWPNANEHFLPINYPNNKNRNEI